MSITTIVADDHPIFRKGLIDVLSGNDAIEIVSEVADGLAAYQQILAKRPDLAILDLEMPGLTGLEVAEKVLSEKSDTRFIILTMHREKAFFDHAMKIGVAGYVLKDNAVEELLTCVASVANGKQFISAQIEEYLLLKKDNHVNLLDVLTATEKVILKLISNEKSSAEIAELLFISPNTVDNHRTNMIKKLKLEGRNALMKFALKLHSNEKL